MKYSFDLIFPFVRLKKSGAAGLLTLESSFGVGNNLLNYFLQSGENAKNRSFNSSEAQKQRDWQSEEWLKQYNIQREEWYNQQQQLLKNNQQQFLFEAEYNSPRNQVQRMSEVGFNPSAALSSGGGLISAATGNMQNVGSVSVPSGGTVSGSSAQSGSSTISPGSNPLDVSVYGQLAKDLAQAAKDNALLEPTVQNLLADYDLKLLTGQEKELLIAFQALKNDILHQTKDTEIKKCFADLENAYMDLKIAKIQGENFSADTLLKHSQRLLNVANMKLSHEQYKKLVFEVSHLDEQWQNQIANWKAQRSEQYASAASQSSAAGYYRALNKTEDEIREFKRRYNHYLSEYQKFSSYLEEVNYVVRSATKSEEIRSNAKQLTEALKREGIITKTMVEALVNAEKNNDWFTYNQLIKIIPGIADAAGAFIK